VIRCLPHLWANNRQRRDRRLSNLSKTLNTGKGSAPDLIEDDVSLHQVAPHKLVIPSSRGPRQHTLFEYVFEKVMAFIMQLVCLVFTDSIDHVAHHHVVCREALPRNFISSVLPTRAIALSPARSRSPSL